MRGARSCLSARRFALVAGIVRFSLLATAGPPPAYHGTLHYRVRGPAAAPYGIGSGLLVGGISLPVAMVRAQNMVARALAVAERLPGIQESPSMRSIHEWAHEGIPIDLSAVLPVTGAYEARIDFTLRRSRPNLYNRESGQVRWTAFNDFALREGEVAITDRFHDSGAHALDPGDDTITLTFERSGAPRAFDLDLNVHHPNTISGGSEMIFGPFGAIMTMQADKGHILLGGRPFEIMHGAPLEIGDLGSVAIGYRRHHGSIAGRQHGL